MSESLEPNKSADVLHVHLVTIKVRIVRRCSIRRLLRIEPLHAITPTRIGSGEKLVTKKVIASRKSNGENSPEQGITVSAPGGSSYSFYVKMAGS